MINYIYEDRILIKVESPSDENQGDYILPPDHESDTEKLSGEVVGTGEEVKNTSLGDIVVFGKFDYTEVIIEGNKYILTNEKNLICKLKENE